MWRLVPKRQYPRRLLKRRIPEVSKYLAELGWSEVSPGKACRSPDKSRQSLEFGNVSILTNSRISVLATEEGEIVDQNECGEQNKDKTVEEADQQNESEKSKAEEINASEENLEVGDEQSGLNEKK